METFYIVALIVFWIMLTCLGAYIAIQKGRALLEGLILGFLFGPLGVIAEGLLPNLENNYEENDYEVPEQPSARPTATGLDLRDAEHADERRVESLLDTPVEASKVKVDGPAGC